MFDIIDGELKISVRRLVEFLCRSGSIDNRFGGISDKSAMEAGTKAHKKIQKSMGPDYNAEVSLRYEQQGERYKVIIDGRADGIFIEDDKTVIDEIKGTYGNLRFLKEAVYVHKAQAMCYAYFYGKENNLTALGVRVSYVNLDSEEIKYFQEVFTITYLEEWFNKLINELFKWGDYLFDNRIIRNASIQGLKFPFQYREGQRELAVSVYKAINRKKNLFIQAPTGVGKTISTVYPSVMALGTGLADKIFYLTAKTITRTVAEEAYSVLRKEGLRFKTVTLTAKDKICMINSETGPECNPVACPYAKNHFNRVNDAVYDLITHEETITRQVIEAYAEKYEVCPFEFSLDVSYWVDGIICDYNYVFDPHVYLKRFFADGEKGNYIFLVDEAHNLVDRAREMYSASMYKEQFLEMKKITAGYEKSITTALERCNKNLLAFKRECTDKYCVIESDGMFSLNMSRLGEELVRFMEKHRDFPYMKEMSEFYFTVMHYNEIYESLDDKYVTYTEHTDNGFMIRLFCVDPSGNLKLRAERGLSAIFFSATLLPINYYKKLLSGNKEDYAIYAHSPFDVNNRLLLVGNDVTSRYKRRNQEEFIKIMNYINHVATTKRGNYLVFFPSYKYMDLVYEQFALNGYSDDYDIIMQNSNMSEQDRDDFINRFSVENCRSLLGFCVMGGIFSEGIDLKDERLIGSIIVGTGIPSISTSCQILRTYFDDRENCGYQYAYIYPGMNKVLQAAGRVIRTDTDRGLILLLDDRFLSNEYQNLFPVEWSNYKVTNINNMKEEILDFWNEVVYNTVENVFI